MGGDLARYNVSECRPTCAVSDMSASQLVHALVLIAIAAAVLLLQGCSDPVRAAVTGSVSKPTALLSPCRTDWHDWDSLRVVDASHGGRLLWHVRANGTKAVPMAQVTYGQAPSDATTVAGPEPLPQRGLIQWMWTRKNSEPVMQSFEVWRVKAGYALETDNSLAPLGLWQNC